MRLHGEDGFQRLKSLDLMERGLRQIQTTVAALLPQARLADRVLTCTDLDDVVSLAQGTARSLNVHCEAKCRCLGPLHVPSAAIRQVMLNLLLNAIKAAGPDGWVRAALCAGGDRFSFHIANSGSLLTPQRLEELIESESGPDPRGFGLWVCRQLAIQAGGGFGTADTSPCGQDDPWGAEPMPRTDFTHLVFWVHNKEEWA
jgi:signal transduction histidine kinase